MNIGTVSRAVTVSLWMFAGGYALAQGSPQACPSEEEYESHRAQVSSHVPIADSTCYVDARAKIQGRLLIDIRTPSNYRRLHIAGSTNIPAAQLPARTHLTHQALLLIGKGHDRSMLAQLCARLHEAGFANVRIQLGGVRALIEEGWKPNRRPAFDELSSISARETLIELLQDRIYLIAADERVVKATPQLSPLFARVLDLADRKGTLDAIFELSGDSRYPAVILGTESHYRAIRGLLPGGTVPNVYFVETGVEGLGQYLRDNVQIQTAMRAVPNRYKCR